MSCYFWSPILISSAFFVPVGPLDVKLLSGTEVVDAIAAASRRARNAQQVLIIGRVKVV